MNGTELKTSAAPHEAEMLTLIRELSAMADRLGGEVRAVREVVAELREDQGSA
ncbi:hypothetical protein OG775_38465 [Streptomyces platensis]|uniref:hypothetical protein n=1 Tax=Streptomyces platensis TaxID=58346 RepID=UPI00224CB559|nr:hypothetical protein [Streptomyces platensis]MCX4640910.1 hypothetical protein [Streptomyces platensis]